MNRKPTVLVLSGLDPSGGAGIQADIQAITALGCHPLPVLTCLTVQDTRNVQASEPVSPELVIRQLECLASDLPFDAVKTGALGNAELAEAIADFLGSREQPLPLVVDPVLVAAGGGALADDDLRRKMQERLFPAATVITPNGPEARTLTGCESMDQAGPVLLEQGAPAALITGGHGEGDRIINRLFTANGGLQQWELGRLPGEYHGSGCTLAAAIAAGLAQGLGLSAAIEQAQRFVAETLKRAFRPGQGQFIPDRGFIPETGNG